MSEKGLVSDKSPDALAVTISLFRNRIYFYYINAENT